MSSATWLILRRELGADAITVHPYLGGEALQPFLERSDKLVFVLARTSNPGAGELQDLIADGAPLYRHVARAVAGNWNASSRNWLHAAGACWALLQCMSHSSNSCRRPHGISVSNLSGSWHSKIRCAPAYRKRYTNARTQVSKSI